MRQQIMLVTIVLFMSLLPGRSFGAVNPNDVAVNQLPMADLMERAIKPGSPPTSESAEFTFFNRQLITKTFAKNRQVLLTFDDGPHPEVTPRILDILKKHGLKAIFFVVGVNVRKFPYLVERIHREGHTIGNHTFHHINLNQHSRDRITKELRSVNDLVEKLTGIRPTVFRPPYGALNRSSLAALQAEGMDVMMWTVDPADWRNRSMAKTMENLKRQMRLNQGGKGGVVLFHDTQHSTAAALEPFLISLAGQGLLTMKYADKSLAAGKSFWGAIPPRTLIWNQPFSFDPDILGRPVLSSLLKRAADPKLTNIGLLRAQKSGHLLKTLLCRSF